MRAGGRIRSRLTPFPARTARSRSKGLTLTEVMVCLAVVGLFSVPVIDLFTTSKKMSVSGRERLSAVELASSLLAGLSDTSREDLRDVERSEDRTLTGPLALAALRVWPPPAGFRRMISLVGLPSDADGPPLWLATVTVEWTGAVSGNELSYSLQRVF